MIVNWSTHKTEKGFTARVYVFAYGLNQRDLKIIDGASRDIVKRQAQKWVRFYKQQMAAGTFKSPFSA